MLLLLYILIGLLIDTLLIATEILENGKELQKKVFLM